MNKIRLMMLMASFLYNVQKINFVSCSFGYFRHAYTQLKIQNVS